MFLVVRAASIAAPVVAGLALAGAALADKWTVQLNAADQKAARAIIVKRSDLSSANGWKGGPVKPSPNSPVICSNFNPKQSDLVQTGTAQSVYKNGALEFDSQAHLLKTAKMVRLDWQRTVEPAALVSCLRQTFSRNLPLTVKFVSFERIDFAQVGTYTAAFRALYEAGSAGAKVLLLVDFVVFAANREEMTLTTRAPYSAAARVSRAELTLARAMFARAEPRSA